MPFKALNNREKDKAERSDIYSHTKNLTFTVKTKRSQSALEYMMTYGWAILIIVIVAVILYSMGIFNPSSSITFTSSGFSPFTVSSSLCNNIGYKIAVLAGPIPNNANSLTINKVYLTLKSGQSATILIPNVACNSANIHYSLSAKIQYSYDVPTIGLQNVNTTGTVAGTSITGKPSTLTSYEPITITNSQSSATPSPFQQMVNFTSSDNGWTSISTGNFGQNVEFFYYNGTVIPSWLENYTSTNAIWWLKIAAIPGGSSETVYVGFAPKATNLFNTVNDGEAPQLTCPNPNDIISCSTYAKYDDGYYVFNGANSYYDNFINNANLSQWQAGSPFQGGNMPYADNGLWMNTNVSGAPVDFHLPINFNFNNAYFITYGSGYNTSDLYLRWGYGILPANPTAYIASVNFFVAANDSYGYGTSFTDDVNSTYYFYYEKGVYYAVSPTQKVSLTLPDADLSSLQLAGQLNSGNAYWAYVAVANVPNNVMPTVKFGAVN